MFFLIDDVIHKEGFYAYAIHHILEKHFSITIAPVLSRGGWIVHNKIFAMNAFIFTIMSCCVLSSILLSSSYPYPTNWGRYNMF
jgi:hypothetical protein